MLDASRQSISVADVGQPEGRLELVLRVAVAAEFIGHGAFGIFGKSGWVAYYEALGIPEAAAWHLMPVTGAVDILLGLLVLTWPMRAPVAWMAFWGLFTAMLRPLAGESGWEVVERSYNFGIPLSLLLLYGFGARAQLGGLRLWVSRVREVQSLTEVSARGFSWLLRIIISAYLVGHGALGFFANKESLLAGYASVGLDRLVDDPATLNASIGLGEILFGLLVLAYPKRILLLAVVIWKVGTEMLFVTKGAYGAGFEVMERASAYAAPIAMIIVYSAMSRLTGRESGAGRGSLSSGHQDETADRC